MYLHLPTLQIWRFYTKLLLKCIGFHCFLSLIRILSYNPNPWFIKNYIFHRIHVVLILSLNYSVTKWHLLFCYFFEIANRDKQNLKWTALKLLVNLPKKIRPYFFVGKEMQSTSKRKWIFRVIKTSCDEKAKLLYISAYH